MGKILSAFVQTSSPFFTKVKSVDQTQVSNNVLIPDDELKFQAKANKTYFIRIFILYTANAAPDIKFAVIIPAGATADRIDDAWEADQDVLLADWEIGDGHVTSTGVEVTTAVYGRVIMGNTAGEVSFAWAQAASSVEDSTVFKGSFMEVYES